MIGITTGMSIALAVLLGLALSTTGSHSYKTRGSHSPWRAYETDLNSVEHNYQYYRPYNHQPSNQLQQQNYNKKSNYYGWNYPTRDQAKKKKVTNNRWKYPSSSTNSFFNKKKDMFDDWNNYLPNIDMKKIKMPNFPSIGKFATTKRPMKPAMPTREWPAYHLLPPIRMISPSLDEPPQPSRRG
ncbi:hypothetical protein JTE90_005070 [Oedothorax gibbosus]|uniref:Uncharacterized protein n=1 Tax=Oedothorax gibbosus TaxID=931172 RepID=A0AAV6VBC0_9ARAC|nr:hypothetical protein JTE90_005070 [Oedothorax gibbosus]